MIREEETQKEDSRQYLNSIVREEERSREDDRETHGQPRVRRHSKKVQWWDVH